MGTLAAAGQGDEASISAAADALESEATAGCRLPGLRSRLALPKVAAARPPCGCDQPARGACNNVQASPMATAEQELAICPHEPQSVLLAALDACIALITIL